MSVLNPNSEEEAQECPLCMELLELDDINFYPCSCTYQICRFCWNKIRTEGNNLCPNCRKPYNENPADFKPLTPEEFAKIKAEKRQKDQAKKQKISESRKHLSNVRVVQRNLVFVVGLSPRLADPDVLKKPEYFGKFGKIHKVVINQNTSYAGNQNQGPSASAYVTYVRSEDALRAIQAVNNISVDGRTIKASLGTTKYCSHFMKNQTCPKHDCMYLHEKGDEAASFTKEEMQQGKHTEYERKLHEDIMGQIITEPNNDRNHESSKKVNCKSSRSPSPRETWPNLASSTSPETTYSDRNGASDNNCRDIQEEPNPEPPNQRLSPDEPLENNDENKAWSRPSTANGSPPPDFSEEDDLGFDPFHETQKALAEMLENESKLVQSAKGSLHMSRMESVFNGGDLNQQFIQQQQAPSRPKAPPPGFNVAPSVHPHMQRMSGLGGYDNMNPFPRVQSFPNQEYGALTNNLGKSSPSPVPPSLRSAFSNNTSNWHGNKDWQEGLKALLPNVNVSFGNLPNNFKQQMPGHVPEPQQRLDVRSPQHHGVNMQPFVRDEMEHHNARRTQGSNGFGGHDWTALDPAIVGGQLSNLRPDSPNNWIKSNLEQLTSDNSKAVHNLLPGFSNMALSSSNLNPRTLSSNQWGVGGLGNGLGLGSGTSSFGSHPPPGFAMNNLGQMPHSFQNLSSLNTNSDGHQIEI